MGRFNNWAMDRLHGQLDILSSLMANQLPGYTNGKSQSTLPKLQLSYFVHSLDQIPQSPHKQQAKLCKHVKAININATIIKHSLFLLINNRSLLPPNMKYQISTLYSQDEYGSSIFQPVI